MKQFIRLVGSRKFAVWLLLLMTFVIGIANFLPKPYILPDFEVVLLKKNHPFIYWLADNLNVREITNSLPFMVTVLFLFLSILVCTSSRIKKRLLIEGGERRQSIPDPKGLAVRSKVIAGVEVSTSAAEDIRRMLLRKGWTGKLQTGDEGLQYYIKGEGGFWGSVVFHAGMLTIIVGAIFSIYTRYAANFRLIEDFDLEAQEISRRLSDDAVKALAFDRVVLTSFVASYEKGFFPVDYVCNLSFLYEGKVRDERIRINEPIKRGGYQFLLRKYGFAPRFVLYGKDNSIIADDVITLSVFTVDNEDHYTIPETSHKIKTRFIPDMIETKGRVRNLSQMPNNPAFLLTIEKDDKILVKNALLPMGRSINFNGYRLEFKDLRYWVQIDVSRDMGMPFILIGFFTMTIGLAIRYLLNEKHLWIIVDREETVLKIGGRALYFPHLFDEELKRLAERIKLCAGH